MYLVIDSKFDPFTYDELMKPIISYGTAYNKAEEDYSDLIKQAETFRNQAAQMQNQESYNRYQQYMTDLKAAADDFSKGMTINNRAALTRLKHRYGTDIVPISQSSIELQKSQKNRQDITAKNPTAIYKKNNYNIDSFLNGEIANDDYIVGDTLTKNALAESTSLIQSTIQEADLKSKLNNTKTPYIVTSQGVDPNDAIRALDDNISAEQLTDPVLKSIRELYDRHLSSSGYEEFDDLGKSQIKDALKRGIIQGVSRKTTPIENKAYETNLQRAQAANYWHQVKESKKASGDEPYAIDKNGNRYYTNGKLQWTMDKDGNMIEKPQLIKTDKPNNSDTPKYNAKNDFEKTVSETISSSGSFEIPVAPAVKLENPKYSKDKVVMENGSPKLYRINPSDPVDTLSYNVYNDVQSLDPNFSIRINNKNWQKNWLVWPIIDYIKETYGANYPISELINKYNIDFITGSSKGSFNGSRYRITEKQ